MRKQSRNDGRTERWFDGHLDLGHLVEVGRDMHASLQDCRGALLPAAITLPSLAEGDVLACLGTIFTEPIDPENASGSDAASAYPRGDAEDSVNAAYRAGMRQLKLYRAWHDAGVIASLHDERATALRLGVLMENADPIPSPDELADWLPTDEGAPGVIAVGLTWTRSSRYAAGNGEPTRYKGGLTDLGRAMVRALDEHDVVHDLSHLADRACVALLEQSDGRIIASHSNARSLLERDNQRHLTDETIKEIAGRGGIIGLNLVRNFIRTGLDPKDPRDRPTISEAIDHVEHVCDLVGNRDHAALGSDMDGGITADDLPQGIDEPKHLTKLAEELRNRGWNDDDVHAFAWGNWARFWKLES